MNRKYGEFKLSFNSFILKVFNCYINVRRYIHYYSITLLDT